MFAPERYKAEVRRVARSLWFRACDFDGLRAVYGSTVVFSARNPYAPFWESAQKRMKEG